MLDDLRGYFMMLCYSVIETRVARAVLGCSVIIVLSFISLRLFGGYVNAPRPTIFITSPQADALVTDKQILVKGRVVPQDSEVTVNGQKVISNGDGTFSQMVQVAAGANVIKFEASYYGRKSGALHTATRILTEEEKAEQTAALLKEKEKVKADANQLATALQSDVLGTSVSPSPQPTATPAPSLPAETDIDKFKLPLGGMIMTQNEVKKNGETILTGIFKNTTGKTLRWVKIKADFKNTANSLIDSKTGAITLPDQHLAPGTEVEYTVPATISTYNDFELRVAYEAL